MMIWQNSSSPNGPGSGRERCWCGGGVTSSPQTFNGGIDVAAFGCSESVYHSPFANGRPRIVSRLYIAGPMTGYVQCNYPAFDRAQALLEASGFEVVNPASFGSKGGHYTDILRDDIRSLLDCHGVATLEGWWESPGARTEVQIAGLLKMPVRSSFDWTSSLFTPPSPPTATAATIPAPTTSTEATLSPEGD